MGAKKVSREQHDPFENDIEFDLSFEATEAKVDLGNQIEEHVRKAERGLIEQIRPSEMLPDRFQPRPVLPVEIHKKLFSGEIGCYQAAQEWIALSEEDRGHRERISELVSMAESVDEHGQIKPITGIWDRKEDGSYQFIIETGERRYWAACLRKVIENLKDEPLLRIEAVESPSAERQIVENRHNQPPTPVAQAREVARLILKKLKIEPDLNNYDPYDFFRLALNLPGRKKLPKGIWSEMEPIMQLSDRTMRQTLSILKMPTPLLESADRHSLSRRVLVAVLSEPEDAWRGLIATAIDQRLTGEEITMLEGSVSKKDVKRLRSKRKTDPAWAGLRGLRGLSGAVVRAGESNRDQVLGTMADEIIIQDDAQNVLDILEELTLLIKVRIQAMKENE